jgi:hypothetical protein
MKTKNFIKAAKDIFERDDFSCFAVEEHGGEQELEFYKDLFEISDCLDTKLNIVNFCFEHKYTGSDNHLSESAQEEVHQIRILALCLAQVIWDSGERFD